MDIVTLPKCLLQGGDVGDLGEQSQLDLGIIGGDELAAFSRDEGAANLAARFGAHRNILQVRFG